MNSLTPPLGCFSMLAITVRSVCPAAPVDFSSPIAGKEQRPWQLALSYCGTEITNLVILGLRRVSSFLALPVLLPACRVMVVVCLG